MAIVQIVTGTTTDNNVTNQSIKSSLWSFDETEGSHEFELESIELINDGTGLAFGIVGGCRDPIRIRTIVPHGCADRDGRLQPGDILLQIDDCPVPVTGFTCEQAASILRSCGVRVQLIIARQLREQGKRTGTRTEIKIIDRAYFVQLATAAAAAQKPFEFDWRQMFRQTCAKNSAQCPNYERLRNTITITRTATNQSLGLIVAGYYCDNENISGIFVKNIETGGLVSQQCCAGDICVNDRICQINGRNVNGLSNRKAIELLKETDDGTLTLCLERFVCVCSLPLSKNWSEILDLPPQSFSLHDTRLPIDGLVPLRDIRNNRVHYFSRFDDRNELLAIGDRQVFDSEAVTVADIAQRSDRAVVLVWARHTAQSLELMFGMASAQDQSTKKSNTDITKSTYATTTTNQTLDQVQQRLQQLPESSQKSICDRISATGTTTVTETTSLSCYDEDDDDDLHCFQLRTNTKSVPFSSSSSSLSSSTAFSCHDDREDERAVSEGVHLSAVASAAAVAASDVDKTSQLNAERRCRQRLVSSEPDLRPIKCQTKYIDEYYNDFADSLPHLRKQTCLTVIEKSPAAAADRFKTGDRILEVNGVDLRTASHEDAVQIISRTSGRVDFLIQSWNNSFLTDQSDNRTSAATIVTASAPSTRSADRSSKPSSNPQMNQKIERLQKLLSASRSLSISEDLENNNNRRTLTPKILDRNNNTAVVTMGKDETSENISEIDTEEALNLNQTDEEDNVIDDEMDGGGGGRGGGEDDDDDEDYDDFEDNVTSLEGRIATAKGCEIDRASAGNVKRTPSEIKADPEDEDYFGYTNQKIQKKYSWLGHSVMLVQLERGNEGVSLGLSLAGHRDRNCMAVFVCGLNPTGLAAKSGAVQVGDEILEVNGIVLHGRCHLNASAIIKSLSGAVFKIIVLRRQTALNDLAVKPITKFPVQIEEEDEEEKYRDFPNVRTVTFRKGPAGLGIMIIEGRHAEVGQGIFISDIQEGSIAEKIGLEIGEMILSVCKESLLGVGYDAAAKILKRVDGVVQVVLSNPKKKSDPDSLSANANGDLLSSPNTPEHLAGETPVKPKSTDPLDCEIVAGSKTIIEFESGEKPIGLVIVGGYGTSIPKGAIVNDVLKTGSAAQDARLQIGDELIEINGEPVEKIASVQVLLTQKVPKYRLLVYRPQKPQTLTIAVDVNRKSSKLLGAVFVQRQTDLPADGGGGGVYISQIVPGGFLQSETTVAVGDQLVSIGNESIDGWDLRKVTAFLKSTTGKTTIKFARFKSQQT